MEQETRGLKGFRGNKRRQSKNERQTGGRRQGSHFSRQGDFLHQMFQIFPEQRSRTCSHRWQFFSTGALENTWHLLSPPLPFLSFASQQVLMHKQQKICCLLVPISVFSDLAPLWVRIYTSNTSTETFVVVELNVLVLLFACSRNKDVRRLVNLSSCPTMHPYCTSLLLYVDERTETEHTISVLRHTDLKEDKQLCAAAELGDNPLICC